MHTVFKPRVRVRNLKELQLLHEETKQRDDIGLPDILKDIKEYVFPLYISYNNAWFGSSGSLVVRRPDISFVQFKPAFIPPKW